MSCRSCDKTSREPEMSSEWRQLDSLFSLFTNYDEREILVKVVSGDAMGEKRLLIIHNNGK